MATYTAKPVTVTARRIVRVDEAVAGHRALYLDDGSVVTADPGMLARMTPVIGDYWVTQQDGYVYLNPKDVFERKYEPAFDLGALQQLRKAGQ